MVANTQIEAPSERELCGNRLLSLLTGPERARLAPAFTRVRLEAGTILQAEDAKIEHVYFPASGAIASTLVMPDEEVTAAITGSEGALFCRDSTFDTSLVRAQVCSGGEAWRMPFTRWQELAAPGTEVARVVAAYNALRAYEMQQNAACCLVHDVESRLCRWLLHIQDCLGERPIDMTHAELASLAGTRRTTVTLITGALHTAGILESHRARLDVADRFALEASACECYGAIRKRRQEFERRLSADPIAAPAEDLA
jgi:CRP-like cAMP-binding protein